LWKQSGQSLTPIPAECDLVLEATLNAVSKYEMDEWEISNLVPSAKTIARKKLDKMSLEHLQIVLNRDGKLP
jgi:hypothetical protein